MTGCMFLDFAVLPVRKNGKRLPCEALQAENAKLREELDAAKCATCEAMLDCDECLRADASQKEHKELAYENAKLRELLAETLMDVHEYAEKYGIEPNYDAVNDHLDARMRELGIEV